MNITIATSLFAESDFDEISTINYAEQKQIPAVQLYMNDNLSLGEKKIEKIRDLCEKKSLKVLCHSPLLIGNVFADTVHCESLSAIFPAGNSKYCIFHFDENCDTDLIINDCEKLINFGLVPCIENFYINKTRHGLVANIEKYLSFFDRVAVLNLPVLPVLDFPRLFIEQFTNFHPIFLSELLIQKFAKRKIIMHVIDSVSPHQHREDWCPVGRGIIGWIDIFDFLKKQSVFVEYAVLEFEHTHFIEESIQNLKRYGVVGTSA